MVSNPDGVGLLGSVELCFELCRWDVAAVAVEPLFVEPVHPVERRVFELVDVVPVPRRVGPEDALGLVEPVGGLGQRVEAPIDVKWFYAADARIAGELGSGRSR